MAYYTYLWLREDGLPYYVGKGKGDRSFFKFERSLNPPERSRIITQEFPDEDSAIAAERFLISYYGRLDLGTGCLRNRTDGGEGISGHTFSKESLEKMRRAALGNKRALGNHTKHARTSEHNRKISLANKGKPWSAARRAAQA